MSNQTEIRNALLLLPEVCFLVVNTTGKMKLRSGKWATLGKYFGGDNKSHDGLSDITGMLKNGKFFAIETKIKDESISVEQIDYLSLVKESGGIAGVARSAEDAIKIIRGKL